MIRSSRSEFTCGNVQSPDQRKSRARSIRGRLGILVCIGAFASGCSSMMGTKGDEASAMDAALAAETEEAVGAVRRMSEFLASRPTLRFESEIRYDAVQVSGEKVEFGSHRTFVLDSPNRARIDVTHWDGAKEIATFDGERFSAALPDRRVYATVEYAGSIAEAFDYLGAEYGLAAPLVDLMRRDLSDDLASRVLSARHLGTVTIKDEVCDQLGFRGEHLDFQLFIRQGDEPVPMRMLIDYHSEPGNPQFRAQMSHWEFASELEAGLFRFLPPAGAQRVPVTELLDLLLGPEENDQ